jgi:hypothetical protein
MALALGGKAGVHLSHQWEIVVSRNTLLRLLRRLPGLSCPTPPVLGVDDFALRKRQTHGTVLINLQCRHPVALLPERTADTVAQWLQKHPRGQVIVRDRATAYADGARQGAPAATQVADRFHLLRTLAEALEQVFHQHRMVLQDIPVPSAVLPLALADQPAVVETLSPPPTAQPAAPLLAAQPPQRTLADLFRHYLADTASGQAASTRYQYDIFYGKILRDFGPLPLGEVTVNLLRDWKLHLSQRHKPSSMHRYLARMGCALAFAVECGWLASNPLAQVRKPSPGKGRTRFCWKGVPA